METPFRFRLDHLAPQFQRSSTVGPADDCPRCSPDVYPAMSGKTLANASSTSFSLETSSAMASAAPPALHDRLDGRHRSYRIENRE